MTGHFRQTIRAAELIVFALFTASCGSSEAVRQSVNDDRFIFAAEDVLKAKLRDPSSAEFTNVRVSRTAGVPAACGEVNSRNGFGGMTGPQRFISGGAAVLESEMEPSEFAKSWAQLCGAA